MQEKKSSNGLFFILNGFHGFPQPGQDAGGVGAFVVAHAVAVGPALGDVGAELGPAGGAVRAASGAVLHPGLGGADGFGDGQLRGGHAILKFCYSIVFLRLPNLLTGLYIYGSPC